MSPPVPLYFAAIAWFVSHPSLLGTENFWLSAFDAGPAAAIPAIVSRIQLMTTVLLWARTQRVSDDTRFLLWMLSVPLRDVREVAEWTSRPAASIGDDPYSARNSSLGV